MDKKFAKSKLTAGKSLSSNCAFTLDFYRCEFIRMVSACSWHVNANKFAPTELRDTFEKGELLPGGNLP